MIYNIVVAVMAAAILGLLYMVSFMVDENADLRRELDAARKWDRRNDRPV